MNASALCQQINAAAAAVAAALPAIQASTTTPDAFMTAVLVAAGLSSSQIQALRDTTSFSADHVCSTASGVVETNLFDNTACAAAMGCANRIDPNYRAQLIAQLGSSEKADAQLAFLAKICTFTITQTNSTTIVQSCNITQTIQRLASAPFDGTVQGAINALAAGAPLDCSTLPTSVTTSDIAYSYGACQLHSELNQGNVALCASGNQSNSADMLQQCVTSSLFSADSSAGAADVPAQSPSQSVPNAGGANSPSSSSSSSSSNVIVIGLAVVLILVILMRR